MMMYEHEQVDIKPSAYSYCNCTCCGGLIAYLKPAGVKKSRVTIVCEWCNGEFWL